MNYRTNFPLTITAALLPWTCSTAEPVPAGLRARRAAWPTTYTPLESMPERLQRFMEVFPSTHFTRFAQAILYRGAGFAVVWPDFAAVAGIGAASFGLALLRFRKTVTLAR